MFLAVADQQRVAALYRRFGRMIFRRCLRLLKDEEHARDATQDIFIKIARHLDPEEAPSTERVSWVYSVTTYHCLDILRDFTRREQRETLSWEVMPAQPPDVFVDRQLAARVLSRFDRKTQAIVIGVLVDGLEHQEVAASLGLSRKTVSRKLDRFLENARKYVARSDV
jgi:RNA polymerase sigma-70 factor (ECF subfamily)